MCSSETLFDREFQLQLLLELQAIYPDFCDFQDRWYNTKDKRKALVNLTYLWEHQLISETSVTTSKTLGNLSPYELGFGRITNKGWDFLRQDGGLSAILNRITVKIDTSQMAQFLKVVSALPVEERQSLLDSLQKIPQTTLEHLIGKAVDMGWDALLSTILLTQNN